MVRYLFPALIFAVSACLAVLVISFARLQAILFDYRFGLAALGVSVFGFFAGLAVGFGTASISGRWKSATWISAAAVAAIPAIGQMTIIPFGGVATYLSTVPLFIMPLFLCGLALARSKAKSDPTLFLWHCGTGFTGAITGLWISIRWSTALGPLESAWWATVGLLFLALMMNRRPKTITFSGIGLIACFLFGFYLDWDFSTPPRWMHDEKNLAKQYYTQKPGDRSTPLATYWDTFSRTDVVAGMEDGNQKRIFTNGTFVGLSPHKQPDNIDNVEQIGGNSPLIALPLMAGKPRNILTINSGLGLVPKVAANMGVTQVRNLESNATTRILMDVVTGRPGIITSEYGKTRNKLHDDEGLYDQIYLTSAQTLDWMQPEPVENYLYTKEAFSEYWSRLKPGGMLVVLSNNELLYMRAMLTAWEVITEDKTHGGDFLVRQAWGYRSVNFASSDPRRYLLMLVKGNIPEDLAAQVRDLASRMRVINLFGPGVTPPRGTINIYHQPYYILYHPAGLGIARKALNDYASRNLQARADLSTTTDRRPLFFEVTRDLHPFLKWLMAACLILLAYIFFIPLSSERRLDSPMAAARPPLPVHLGYFLFLGLGVTFAVTAIFHQSLLGTDSGGSLISTLTGTALGVATGMTLFWGKFRYLLGQQWPRIAITAIVFSVFSAWPPPSITLEWPTVGQIIFAGGLSFMTGAFAAMLLIPGLQFLGRNLPPLISWSWITFGTAIATGVIIAFWIAQYWGFSFVWLASASCYLLMLGMGLWLHWAERHESKRATQIERSDAASAMQ